MNERLVLYKRTVAVEARGRVRAGERCDVMSIDGGHTYENALADLEGMHALASTRLSHVAFIDDTNCQAAWCVPVDKAVAKYGQRHNLTILERYGWSLHKRGYAKGLTVFRYGPFRREAHRGAFALALERSLQDVPRRGTRLAVGFGHMTGGANTSTFEFTRDGMPTQDTPCLTVNDVRGHPAHYGRQSHDTLCKGGQKGTHRCGGAIGMVRAEPAAVGGRRLSRHAIVVVDNSVGALLRAAERYPHLETINFNHTRQEERRHCGHKASAMGEQELVSIGHAMRTSSRINNPRTTHILKITGRYYAPGLAEHLKGLTRVHARIRQGSTSGVGCEALGCKLGPPGLQPSLPRGFCSYAFRCPYAKGRQL